MFNYPMRSSKPVCIFSKIEAIIICSLALGGFVAIYIIIMIMANVCMFICIRHMCARFPPPPGQLDFQWSYNACTETVSLRHLQAQYAFYIRDAILTWYMTKYTLFAFTLAVCHCFCCTNTCILVNLLYISFVCSFNVHITYRVILSDLSFHIP